MNLPLSAAALPPLVAHNALPNYPKAFSNYAMIRKVEATDPQKIQVAYIRGRELFVIRPDNWKGFNSIRQIWFLFNRLVFRYVHVDSGMITAHPLHTKTVAIVKSDKYLDWLANTHFCGPDQRRLCKQLTENNDKLQEELDSVKAQLAQAEISKNAVLEENRKFHDAVTNLKKTDERQYSEIQALQGVAKALNEKPPHETQIHYDEAILALKKSIDKDRELHTALQNYFANLDEARKISTDKEILDRLKELYARYHKINFEYVPEERKAAVAQLLTATGFVS